MRINTSAIVCGSQFLCMTWGIPRVAVEAPYHRAQTSSLCQRGRRVGEETFLGRASACTRSCLGKA